MRPTTREECLAVSAGRRVMTSSPGALRPGGGERDRVVSLSGEACRETETLSENDAPSLQTRRKRAENQLGLRSVNRKEESREPVRTERRKQEGREQRTS